MKQGTNMFKIKWKASEEACWHRTKICPEQEENWPKEEDIPVL